MFPLVLEKGRPGKDKACGEAWLPSAVEELCAFAADTRELDASAHAFGRLEGHCSQRKVWSFDLAPYQGLIARRAIVDQ